MNRQLADHHNDTACPVCAELLLELTNLRHDAEQWRRLMTKNGVTRLVDYGDEEYRGPLTLATSVSTEYADGVTTFTVEPPDAEVALTSLDLLRAITAEHNAWKRRARDYYFNWREQMADTPTDAEWAEVDAEVRAETKAVR